MPFIPSVGEAERDTIGMLLLELTSYSGKFGVEDNELLHQQLRLKIL